MAGNNKRRIAPGKRDNLRNRVKHEYRPCHLCGYPIDYNANHLSKTAFELDEIVPISRGGSPTEYENVAAAHRCCNQWRGNRALTPRLCVEIRERFEREVLHKKSRRDVKSVEVKCSREW